MQTNMSIFSTNSHNNLNLSEEIIHKHHSSHQKSYEIKFSTEITQAHQILNRNSRTHRFPNNNHRKHHFLHRNHTEISFSQHFSPEITHGINFSTKTIQTHLLLRRSHTKTRMSEETMRSHRSHQRPHKHIIFYAEITHKHHFLNWSHTHTSNRQPKSYIHTNVPLALYKHINFSTEIINNNTASIEIMRSMKFSRQPMKHIDVSSELIHVH